MAYLKALVLVCVTIGVVFGQVQVSIDPQPDISTSDAPITKSTSIPTTAKPTSAPSTSKPTTAPPTTKPTTAPPTTKSTTAPPTTKPTTAPPTPKPTPAPQPNTTTTATTTTAKPTPTPAPAPVDPVVGNWTVDYDKSNRTCIVVQVALQYEVLDPKSNETWKFNVPAKAQATGSCEDKDKQNLKLWWGQNNSNSLEFDFMKTNTTKFELDDVMASLNLTLPGADSKIYNLVHKKPEFSTPLENSYKCARVQTLNLTQENANVTFAYLHVSHVQFQAFRNATGHTFDSAMDCEGSSTPDIVPIVVGCVLAALVIMVLIAYLVGRRRCQARGYLSM